MNNHEKEDQMLRLFTQPKSAHSDISAITTAYYTAWTDMVDQFLQTIAETGSKESDKSQRSQKLTLLYAWASNEGKQAYQKGQGKFFMQHIETYTSATTPLKENLLTLTKEQVIEGFNAWFKALVEKFPEFSSDKITEEFNKFIEQCKADDFDEHIALRTVFTYRYVKTGNRESVLKGYEKSIERCGQAINAMKESEPKLEPKPEPEQENTTKSSFS
ncbi:hypothetical protein [Legionella erythra]|nr:hypothetical protein [Legionella erythra]